MQERTVYEPEDRKIEGPGEYPFTRGIYPNMYRGRLWTMRQYAGFGTAEDSNKRYHYLLQHGQTGLSIAFDLPTQMGMDPDHPLAAGEVGKVGVSVTSLRDMEVLLNGIPLDRVSISMTINSTAAILLAMVLCIARRQGVSWASLRGTIQNDILKEYIARGTYIYPPTPSLRLTTDIFAFCLKEVPNWNTVSVSGYHIREAGATAAQEVAFSLADGITYVQSALNRGLAVDDVAPQISFFFSAHNNLIEETAKFRAARRLWARLMRQRFAAVNPASWALRFHAQTAGSTLTAQQPENNIVRVAIQALAAVLGGAQSLHSNSLDEALALPSSAAVQTALRTQQILAFESGVANTVDPMGGSYAVEHITDEIEAEAEEYLRKIDSMGGMMRAIEAGHIQREIQESAYRHQRRVESGETIIVGLNRYANAEQPSIETLVVDAGVSTRRRSAVQKLLEERDSKAVASTLSALRQAALGSANLLPWVVDAVGALCTIGEISDCLRDVFGEYRESVVL